MLYKPEETTGTSDPGSHLHSVNVYVFTQTIELYAIKEKVLTVCFCKDKMVPLMREGEAGEQPVNKSHSKCKCSSEELV